MMEKNLSSQGAFKHVFKHLASHYIDEEIEHSYKTSLSMCFYFSHRHSINSIQVLTWLLYLYQTGIFQFASPISRISAINDCTYNSVSIVVYYAIVFCWDNLHVLTKREIFDC